MLLAAVAAMFGLCFCIFNYWFQKEKYSRMVREELETRGKQESPRIWLILSIILFIALLGIVSYYIYQLALAVRQLQG